MLKTLYKRINELSNTNLTTSANLKETNEKGEKIKKDAKATNPKDKEESNKVLNTLVDKLIKKFDFVKQDEFKAESDLVNTKIYKNLMKKYSFTTEADNDPGFLNSKSAGFNNIHQDEKLIRVSIFITMIVIIYYKLKINYNLNENSNYFRIK